jgi:hypothetical protein
VDEREYLASRRSNKLAVERRQGAGKMGTNLVKETRIGRSSSLARPAVFGRCKTRYFAVDFRAQKQVERLLIRVEHPVARRQEKYLEAQIHHGLKLSSDRSSIVDEFVPVTLPNMRPIAFLHCLGVPRLVLETERFASDHKPLFSQILLEPQAGVALKYDVADVYCD